MQLPFVAARHPAAIVPVNGVATDLIRTFLGFGRSVIHAFPVGVAWTTADQDGSKSQCHGWSNLPQDIEINLLHSAGLLSDNEFCRDRVRLVG